MNAVRQHAREGLLPAAAFTVGLDEAEFNALRQAVDAPAPGFAAGPGMGTPSPLLAPLIALLWSHRSSDAPWTRLMAGTIGSASFGARHLWQDLGAAGRPEVSALMERHFPSLARLNLRNLKWKHHLFMCLGTEMGQPDLRPPRCDGCEEQPVCFPGGPVAVTFRSRHDSPAKKEERAT